ncbi:MAG: alpha/beta hydrolase [Nitrospira sp. SB0677_bin_15]|nr:alpha/beta hydrolase [Nitrospira sp. SB0667_bin_9]MYD31935.1 alpha/beta hydrolase [Nitrospira sp. SB0661_bin_20]MYG39466.1 alpha/beta hydrolase [Nitrospira sp. SB0677_bin_15]MYH01829.1 alpha/beta hydrolase [Nitrospira sp. SB0675_bin_23]MYJ22133.1 alpha/beta hydrolase [Nitrospira sp. SB0673_bin_12]
MTLDPVWEIPEPRSVCEVRLDESTVTTLRRHGNPDGVRLVLSHGNGLAIDLYYPFWSLLADEFDLIIYDLRNHGWNTVGARKKHNVATLIRDQECILEAIDRHFGNKPKIGVFHSASALVSLFLSADSNSLAAQVLFDPPLYKPGRSRAEFDDAAERAAALTRRRAYRFQKQEDFVELLSYLPAFTRVVPGVLDLMAKTTLRPSPNGQDYELRCPREYEAQIMDYIGGFSPLVDLGTLPCPTKIVGADPTLPFTYLPTVDFEHVMTVEYDFLPETTHYLQLEAPKECVTVIREFLEHNGLL